MQQFKGALDKMQSKQAMPVEYFLVIGNTLIEANKLINKNIHIKFNNKITCKACGVETKKSFGQGYCYPCFLSVPQTAPCILHPEKCEAHKGIYRDKNYAEQFCLRPHYVYIALTAGIKVGVTRETQVPTRWIDQGAVQAIKLAKTPNRHTAGLIETYLKQYFSDKTSWQKILKNEIQAEVNLIKQKHIAKKLMPQEFKKFVTFDNSVMDFKYPVNKYPKKIKSISLDKIPEYKGKLTGIKGQYLIFEDGGVFNVRKHTSYEVVLMLD